MTAGLWAFCAFLIWFVVWGVVLGYTNCGVPGIAVKAIGVALLFPALVAALVVVRMAWYVFLGRAVQAADVFLAWCGQYARWYRRRPQITCVLTILLPLALWSMFGRIETHRGQLRKNGASVFRYTIHDRMTGATHDVPGQGCGPR